MKKEKHAFLVKPHRSRPRALNGAESMPSLQVRGIEVSQSIQRIDGLIGLIAHKATMVRIYVDPQSAPSHVPVTAEIAWKKSGAESYLPVMGELRLDPGVELQLAEQRLDLAHSFNVRLPAEAVDPGTTSIRVSRLRLAGGDDFRLSGNLSTTVDFIEAPPLRIRAVGLRYKAGTRTVTPEARHFSYLRSYLERAYPTAQVIWSQIVVDANFAPPFEAGTPILANAQLAAMRSREVSAGVDARTHYVGLVDDDNGRNFMRGRASDIPGLPAPDTVCSAPVGRPGGFGGDHDESYADWYGAHELAHTFGRYHPGFPVGEQDQSDLTFPYKDGLITHANDVCIGLDLGDVNLGLPARALDGTLHHDVMTYAASQWVSEYTFNAILERLRLEDAMI